MIAFLKTTTGKITALIIFYIPFFSALFFLFFEGNTYESPIGGCCIPMEGVVAAAYALFTIWLLTPALLIYGVYALFRRYVKR